MLSFRPFVSISQCYKINYRPTAAATVSCVYTRTRNAMCAFTPLVQPPPRRYHRAVAVQ